MRYVCHALLTETLLDYVKCDVKQCKINGVEYWIWIASSGQLAEWK